MNSPGFQQAMSQFMGQHGQNPFAQVNGQLAAMRSGQPGAYQQATGAPWSGQGQYQAQNGSPLQAGLMGLLQGTGQGQCPPWNPNCNRQGGGGFGGGFGGGGTGGYGSAISSLVPTFTLSGTTAPDVGRTAPTTNPIATIGPLPASVGP